MLHFNTFTGVRDLGPALTAAAGFAEARVTVRPGAFDWQLKKCITGNVSHAVRFQFSHIAETKCASTISGTLKLWASRESLFFGITGSTHDGASSIRWAKTFDHLQKVSAAFHYREFNVIRGDHPGANVIEVTRGEITEISLVETAAFPNTSISFI